MLLIVRGSGDAGNDPENSAQPVVHPINRICDPAASTTVPALPFQDGIEEAARSRRRRHGVQDAGMSLFLESRFPQKLPRVRIVGQGAFALGAVAGFVAILGRFHSADGYVEAGDPVPPAVEALA